MRVTMQLEVELDPSVYADAFGVPLWADVRTEVMDHVVECLSYSRGATEGSWVVKRAELVTP